MFDPCTNMLQCDCCKDDFSADVLTKINGSYFCSPECYANYCYATDTLPDSTFKNTDFIFHAQKHFEKVVREIDIEDFNEVIDNLAEDTDFLCSLIERKRFIMSCQVEGLETLVNKLKECLEKVKKGNEL